MKKSGKKKVGIVDKKGNRGGNKKAVLKNDLINNIIIIILIIFAIIIIGLVFVRLTGWVVFDGNSLRTNYNVVNETNGEEIPSEDTSATNKIFGISYVVFYILAVIVAIGIVIAFVILRNTRRNLDVVKKMRVGGKEVN